MRCHLIAPFDFLNSEGLTQWRVGQGRVPPCAPPPPQPLRGLGRLEKHADMSFHTIFKFPRLASLLIMFNRGAFLTDGYPL